jgi:hypothetical protein
MDSAALVTDEISAGSAVLRRLDEAAIPVRAALWGYNDAAGEWRYIVATQLADVEGPRSVYERIQRALARSEETRNFPIWRLVTVSPKSEMVSLLRRLVGKLENDQGLALQLRAGTPYDGNVLVYRMA